MTAITGTGGAPLPGARFGFRRHVALGFLTIVLIVGGFTAWSVYAPLASGAIAPGRTVVDSNRKEIQHFEGGIVESILVRDGDRVKADDPLVVLDRLQAGVERGVLVADYLGLLGERARLIAELAGRSDIDFPAGLYGEEDAERKQEVRETQSALFTNRKATREGELAIYEKRIEQLHETILGLRRKVEATNEEIALIAATLVDYRKLLDQGLFRRSEVIQFEQRAARLKGEKATDEAKIAELGLQITENELKTVYVGSKFMEDASNRISEIRPRIFDLEEQIIGADDKVQRTTIRAPIDGVVFNSQAHTEGGVIRPGDVIMEIVPGRERIVIEARVSPLDIDAIAIGDSAEVRFSSLSSRLTPLLDGIVEQVSADAVVDEREREYYRMRVVIPGDQFARIPDVEIVPGMPVEVLVKKGERSAIAYLVEPLSKMFFRALKEE